MKNENYRLEMRGISKRFGGIRALEDVSVKIKPGEIHALIGENSPAKIAELGMKIAQEILVDGADPESYDDITMTQAAAVTVDNVDEHYEYGF